MGIRLFVAALTLATFASAADFDSTCMDDEARDLCQESVRDHIAESLGAEPAAKLAAAGVEGIRVLVVDGHGNERPMVAVQWSETGRAVIETRLVREPGHPEVLTAPATPWIQSLVKALMDETIRSPVKPEPVPADWICLHGWVTATEVLHHGSVTTRVRAACATNDGDVVYDGSLHLSTVALSAYPFCSGIGGVGLNDSLRLMDCATVRGARTPWHAVTVLVRSEALSPLSVGQPTAVENVLGDDVVLTLHGEPPVTGRNAVAARWKALASHRAEKPLALSYLHIDADEKTATATGIVYRSGPKEDEQAEFRQEWRVHGFAPMIHTWTIGPFTPAR